MCVCVSGDGGHATAARCFVRAAAPRAGSVNRYPLIPFGGVCWAQVLGLTKGCSEKDIKQAYRHLALELHPDKLGPNATEADTLRFMEVCV